MSRTHGGLLLGLGLVVGVAAVIAGVVVTGTPREGRMQRLDGVRVRDLGAIVASIDRFWRQHERLPDSLAELDTDPRTQVAIRDPDTAQPYEYRRMDEDAYELCAVFQLPSIRNERLPDDFWQHDEGRQCFSLRASDDEQPAILRR